MSGTGRRRARPVAAQLSVSAAWPGSGSRFQARLDKLAPTDFRPHRW